MTIDTVTAYLSRGFAVVHIPPRQKFPTHENWNRPGGYFTESTAAVAHWKAHPRDNLGVVLEPSQLCSLDVDQLEYTQRVLAELGIGLDTLVKNHPTIQGHPERRRITFKAPIGIALARKTLVWPGQNGTKETTVFELRAGLVQDVWPPSIHPDTGQPYRWITPLPEGDLPKLPTELLELWQHWEAYKDSLIEVCPWATPKEKPSPKRSTEGVSVIAAFNQGHSVARLLEQHGYQRKGKRWLAPSSSTKLPGVVVKDGRVYSHHGSDRLADGYAHDAFDVYRILEHDGNFKEAVKAAAKLLGLEYKAKESSKSNARRDVPADSSRVISNFSNFSNFSNDEPLPLRRDIPPPESFPLEALGDVLGAATQAMQEVIQSPAAICGQSTLAGATLAVQGHADVVIDGRSFPTSNYFVSIADSGERKTASDDAALWPHYKRQRNLRLAYDRLATDYEVQLAAWKKAREEALSSKYNKTLEAKKAALRELGPEPTGPIDAVLMVEEPTYEGLVKALARGWPSMGLFSNEGGRFLGGHGMNADNQLKTAAGLCKLWDGSPISRTRGGDGNILLYGRRLSVHLMIQPAISHLLFGNSLLIGQGLLSRCLVSWPESNIGQHRYKETVLGEQPAMKQYFARLMAILEADLPLCENSLNELNPRPLPLSPEAKRLWIGFHDHISALCGPDKELAPIRGLAAKAAEHAARLAGVLTLVRDIHAGYIALTEMEAGIELCQFYLGEALRLFEAAAINPDLELAEKCLVWAQMRGIALTLPDLYQYGPNTVRDKETAKRIVTILEEHGWVRPIPGGTEVNGKHRRLAWEVHS